jgi:hypothetical protein
MNQSSLGLNGTRLVILGISTVSLFGSMEVDIETTEGPMA